MCSGCDSKSTATGGDAPPPKTETLKGKDGKEETRTTVPD
jgi:hypothetical protein